MIDPVPLWGYAPGTNLTGDYEYVRLLDDCVLGQWWCLDRESGALRWSSSDREATSVVGISEGVIIATKLHVRGPTTTHGGTWAISLATGETLWTFEGFHLLSVLWRLLTGRGDDLHTNVVSVRGGECIRESGEVLDLHTGAPLRRESLPYLGQADRRRGLADGLEHFDDGEFLMLDADGASDPLRFRRVDREDTLRWAFDARDHRMVFGAHASQFRRQGNFAYLLASSSAYDEIENRTACDWSLWALDLRSGVVAQRHELTSNSSLVHRIEDADGNLLLWSRGDQELYAHRIHPADPGERSKHG